MLASQVLRLASSAYSAPAHPISTVTQALVRLGTSVGAAYRARLIAERVEVSQDEAFLLGLLHDIGKLEILRIPHDHQTRTKATTPAPVLDCAGADLLEDPALTFLGLDEAWLAATDARAPGLVAEAREVLR